MTSIFHHIIYTSSFKYNYTHNTHPYNKEHDIQELNELKIKYKQYFEEHNSWPQCITIWTDRDVMKRNTVKQNKLRWIEFFYYDKDMILNTIQNYIDTNQSGILSITNEQREISRFPFECVEINPRL